MEKIKPFNHDISAAIRRIAADISHSDRVVILSGAGISTESGIPDFRGPDGVWTKNPDAERTATLQNFINNRDYRVMSWKTRIKIFANSPQPNRAHFALVELEKKGS